MADEVISFELYPYMPQNKSRIWVYPGALQGAESRSICSVVVKLATTCDEPWFAVVEGSGEQMFLMPDHHSVFIDGYVIDVLDPENWTKIGVYPIEHMIWSNDELTLLFGDHTRLEAFGEIGRKWISAELVLDALAVEQIGADEIKVSGYDIIGESEDDRYYLTIDAHTGRQISGPVIG